MQSSIRKGVTVRGVFVALVGAALLCPGCGSNPPAGSRGAASPGPPAWTADSLQIADGELAGTGVVRGVRNKASAIEAAQSLAIETVSAYLRGTIEEILREYAAVVRKTAHHVEGSLSDARRSLVERAVAAVAVTDRFIDPLDGAVYARAGLDIGVFEELVDSTAELDAEAREFVKAAAGRAFEGLARRGGSTRGR